MRQPNLFWAILLIPSTARKLLEYNQVKISLGAQQWLASFESIAGIALFVWIGLWLGYELSKDDAKTFDRLQQDHRKDLKDHYEKIRESIVAVEKDNSHFKAHIESLKSDIQQRERLIQFLQSSLLEEKKRNERTPAEANKLALEAIS